MAADRADGGEDMSGYVRLISSDGHEFVLEKKYAMVSQTIKSMFAASMQESRGEARFPEIRGAVLEKVIQYFHYKVKYSKSKVPIPEFEVPAELSLEMLMASNFLDC